MLAALQKMLGKRNSLAQFSMEEKMGCGVGLCFSCTCKVKKDGKLDTALAYGDSYTAKKELSETEWSYERVCTRGPVFRGDEVILHD